MIRSIPIPENVDAVKVAKLFKDHIYRNHGLPQTIISDRDRIFMSKFWKTLFELLGNQDCTVNSIPPANRRTV